MRLEILAPAVERLVGRDERDAVRVGEIEQAGLDLLFFRPAVALQLDVEPVAEHRGEPRAARRSQVRLPGRERVIERPAGPAGQHDQAIGRLLKRIQLDVRRLSAATSRKARDVSAMRLR